MRGMLTRWGLGAMTLATPLMLAGCHEGDTSSVDVVDIIFAVTDLVLAIINAVD